MNKVILQIVSFVIFYLNTLDAQTWKQYPYSQPGTVITFPLDEGRHSNAELEWWYLNAHLMGVNSGKTYSIMLTYFYKPSLGSLQYRLFNIADDSLKKFYSNSASLTYTNLSNDHLNIKALTSLGKNEKWVTKRNSHGQLIPFEYQITAFSPSGGINLDCISQKRPLILGDDGFFYQGADGYTYYYSLTHINISGTLTLNGITEPVVGVGWMDHQYGKLESTVGETYEWFSIQLSNGIGINLWSIFTNQNQIPLNENYRACSIYLNEQNDTTVHNYELSRLKYAFMPITLNCFSQQWRFIWGNIDLIITAAQPNCEITPYQFYEGSTRIQGTVNGVPVTGVGFAELIHRYKKPIVDFLNAKIEPFIPNSILLQWNNINPDDGCPLLYDLDLSNNNGSTFKNIARRLTASNFLWDTTGSNVKENSLLRITAYSSDSLLSGFDSTRFNTLVPVEPIIFKVTKQNKSILLNWMVMEAREVLGFEVERSRNGEKFKKIGFVEGHASITINHEYKFLDNPVEKGKYFYRLKQIDVSGTHKYSKTILIENIPDLTAGVANFPNPFNPTTQIQFHINQQSSVVLKIYDILGNEIASLVNEEKEAGSHTVIFDASNLSSGVYFCELMAGSFREIKKMLLIR